MIINNVGNESAGGIEDWESKKRKKYRWTLDRTFTISTPILMNCRWIELFFFFVGTEKDALFGNLRLCYFFFYFWSSIEFNCIHWIIFLFHMFLMVIWNLRAHSMNKFIPRIAHIFAIMIFCTFSQSLSFFVCLWISIFLQWCLILCFCNDFLRFRCFSHGSVTKCFGFPDTC